MSKYIILTDSCIDLTAKLADELELKVIPLMVRIKGKEYYNFLDEREITAKAVYDSIRQGIIPTTAQANPERFVEVMEPLLKEGYDLLYIGFSSALSGTFNSSLVASDELKERYPERVIICLDSLSASMGMGLLLTYAANLKKSGKNIHEVAKWVEENRLKLCHLFTVGDLNHLRRGGRLSYAKAFLGTLLKVKPLLHVNQEGKLVQTGTTRGRRSSLMMMVERMKATIEQPEGQMVYISHGDCADELDEIIETIKKELPIAEIKVNYVGPVIGAHSGVGTVAIFYLGNDRMTPYKK